MKQKPLFSFVYLGVLGSVFPGRFVCWGGASFQIEAARPGLRTAIVRAGKAAGVVL